MLTKPILIPTQDLGADLPSLLEDKDACRGDPIVAETQRFYGDTTYLWPMCGYVVLGRYQQKAGSWSAWSGRGSDTVPEMGFKVWVDPYMSRSNKGGKASCETYQSSQAATDASTQASGSSSTINAGAEMMQLSQGQAMLPFTAQLPFGHFSASSTSQIAVKNHDQGLWSPIQQLNQIDLFLGHENEETWSSDSYGFVPAVSAAADGSFVFADSNNFSMDFTDPFPAVQPTFDIAGAPDNTLDCNNMSFGDTLTDLDTALDGVHASTEPDQTPSADFYAGSAEYLDNLPEFDFDVDLDFDAATWSPYDASKGY